MTTLLEMAGAEIRKLSPERQEDAAALLLEEIERLFKKYGA